MKYTKNISVFIVLLLFTSTLFASGGNRIGTAGAQHLLIQPGARGIALSNSGIASLTGIEAIYYNPAGLSGSKKATEVAFSNMSYIADMNFIFGAVAVNVEGFGSIGLNVRSLDVGDIPETTVEQPAGTGATFSPTFIVVGLTYSNFLTDRIKAGVNVNLVSESIMNTSATGLSLDVGIQYTGLVGFDGLMLGVVLRNFGPDMSYGGTDLQRQAVETSAKRGTQFYRIETEKFELPSQLEIGLAYRQDIQDDFAAVFSGSVQNNNFANDEYNIGAEVSYNDMVFLRGGYSVSSTRDNISDNENDIYGATFGAGFKIKGDLDIIIDYAFRDVKFFDSNQVFGIQIGF